MRRRLLIAITEWTVIVVAGVVVCWLLLIATISSLHPGTWGQLRAECRSARARRRSS